MLSIVWVTVNLRFTILKDCFTVAQHNDWALWIENATLTETKGITAFFFFFLFYPFGFTTIVVANEGLKAN